MNKSWVYWGLLVCVWAGVSGCGGTEASEAPTRTRAADVAPNNVNHFHAATPASGVAIAGNYPQIPIEQVWVQRRLDAVGVYSTPHCAELIDALPLGDIFTVQPYSRNSLDWPAVYALTIEALPGDVVSVDFEGMITSERDTQTAVISYATIVHPNGAIKPILRKFSTNLDRRDEHHLQMTRRATFVVPGHWTDGLLTIEWNWGAFAFGDGSPPYALDVGVDGDPINDNRCYGGMIAMVYR